MRTQTTRSAYTHVNIVALFAASLSIALTIGGCPTGVGNIGSSARLPDSPPDFAAARFSDPTTIDNTYFPLVPGSIVTFEGTTESGLERFVSEVLAETKEVAGVASRVVLVREYIDGVLVEETRDWFAQDDDGNVWYMGEAVDNYELDAAGNLFVANNNGAWEAGKDVAGAGSVAQPGFIMPGSPGVGDLYYQEFYAGEAEDVGEVVALAVSLTLRDGTTYTCLRTRDTTPLEPDTREFKYYVAGIGLIAEEDIASGDRLELIERVP
ncbi:MAG: hypothetical protein ACKVS9_19995 [Phycisphaerae bacterium]